MNSETVERPKGTATIKIQVPPELDPRATGIQIVLSWTTNHGCEIVNAPDQNEADRKIKSGQPLQLRFYGQTNRDTVAVMYVGSRLQGGIVTGNSKYMSFKTVFGCLSGNQEVGPLDNK